MLAGTATVIVASVLFDIASGEFKASLWFLQANQPTLEYNMQAPRANVDKFAELAKLQR